MIYNDVRTLCTWIENSFRGNKMSNIYNNIRNKITFCAVAGIVMAITLVNGRTEKIFAVENDYTGWEIVDGNWYWYENGVKQGLEGRGKEIYDPGSNAWYWLDAVDGGKKATGKDLYQESEAGDWAENSDGTGKWVRYDDEGHMVKGWYTNDNGTYYFDLIYGTMAKGGVLIEGKPFTFDVATGVLKSDDNGWKVIDGIEYWYENGVRQGTQGRGKEIYDPGTNAWYWLDAVDNGKKAVSKDVYQESKADDAGNIGKWVRYDAKGHMVKGWDTNSNGTYYFDLVYGTMYKGEKEIDGKKYNFDVNTGILLEDNGSCNLSKNSRYYKYELAYRTGKTTGFTADDYKLYKGLKACLDSAYKYETMYEREKAVFDWIVLNCAYDYDNYLKNTVPSAAYRPEGVFDKGFAVCEGYTESFKLCMDIIGIPCEKIYGKVNDSAHAWNAIKLEADWYMVDVTWGDPVPDVKGRVSYRYFNVTDEQLKKDHTFTSSIYAQGTKYNYFRQVIKTIPSDDEYVKQAKELFKASNGFEEKILKVMVYGKNENDVSNKLLALTSKIDAVAMYRNNTWSSADLFETNDLYFVTYNLKLVSCDDLTKCAEYVTNWAKTAKAKDYLFTSVMPERVAGMTQQSIEKKYFSNLSNLGVTFKFFSEVENGVTHYKLYFAKN